MTHSRDMLRRLPDQGIEDVDLDAIMRFANDAINRRPPAPDDAYKAAVMLYALIQAVRRGDRVNLKQEFGLRKKKVTTSKVDPAKTFMGSPAWYVVERYVRKEIRHKDAVTKMMALARVEQRKAAELVAAIRPAVVKTLRAVDALAAMAENAARKQG